MTGSSRGIGVQGTRIARSEQRTDGSASPAVPYQEDPSMLKPLSVKDARLVREFLASAQYTQKEFQEKLPLREMPGRDSPDLQLWLERFRDPSTLHVLLRCF